MSQVGQCSLSVAKFVSDAQEWISSAATSKNAKAMSASLTAQKKAANKQISLLNVIMAEVAPPTTPDIERFETAIAVAECVTKDGRNIINAMKAAMTVEMKTTGVDRRWVHSSEYGRVIRGGLK